MEYQLSAPADGGYSYPQIVVAESRSPGELPHILETALSDLLHTGTESENSALPVMLWIRGVTIEDDDTAVAHGFAPHRDLWQMRCQLPAAERPTLHTRPFRAEDLEELVALNNRAFRWHPEQGKLTVAKMRSLTAQNWFDADGFRLSHSQGCLTGFCWTKVHSDSEPPIGEMYVLAVEPDFAGRGLGRQLALTGLNWLACRGLDTGMLYVESGNQRAHRIYRQVGFRHHRTDRAYWRTADAHTV